MMFIPIDDRRIGLSIDLVAHLVTLARPGVEETDLEEFIKEQYRCDCEPRYGTLLPNYDDAPFQPDPITDKLPYGLWLVLTFNTSEELLCFRLSLPSS